MSSIFEELASLDRPFVTVRLNFGGKLHELQCRRPNALESDAIDSYYSDEYAKLIVKYTEPKEDGSPNELEQMRKVARLQTKEALIATLVATRRDDISRATMTKLDFNPAEEAAKYLGVTDEAEREAIVKERKAEFDAAHEAAKDEIRAEYEHQDHETLAETVAQVNLNMKALMEAATARQACFVYYTLHDGKGNRISPSAEAVMEKFQTETIRHFTENIEAAFALAVRQDLPFVSPGESEPSGQPSSVNTSEPETTPSKVGSRRTRRRRNGSKPSTKPQGGTASKKD